MILSKRGPNVEMILSIIGTPSNLTKALSFPNRLDLPPARIIRFTLFGSTDNLSQIRISVNRADEDRSAYNIAQSHRDQIIENKSTPS